MHSLKHKFNSFRVFFTLCDCNVYLNYGKVAVDENKSQRCSVKTSVLYNAPQFGKRDSNAPQFGKRDSELESEWVFVKKAVKKCMHSTAWIQDQWGRYFWCIFVISIRSMEEGYVFTGVCHSVHNWGMVCPWGVCPGGSHFSHEGVSHFSQGVSHFTENGRPPPQPKNGNTVNARSVRILLECILVLISILCYIWSSKWPEENMVNKPVDTGPTVSLSKSSSVVTFRPFYCCSIVSIPSTEE